MTSAQLSNIVRLVQNVQDEVAALEHNNFVKKANIIWVVQDNGCLDNISIVVI